MGANGTGWSTGRWPVLPVGCWASSDMVATWSGAGDGQQFETRHTCWDWARVVSSESAHRTRQGGSTLMTEGHGCEPFDTRAGCSQQDRDSSPRRRRNHQGCPHPTVNQTTRMKRRRSRGEAACCCSSGKGIVDEAVVVGSTQLGNKGNKLYDADLLPRIVPLLLPRRRALHRRRYEREAARRSNDPGVCLLSIACGQQLDRAVRCILPLLPSRALH
jgi:hypothetical protein